MAAVARDIAKSQTVFGISRLSREFKLDRRTVVKRLEDVPPNGKDPNGQAGWTLDIAAPALFAIEKSKPTAEETVRPYDRDKFYSAQLKRIEYEREMKQLVPVDEVRTRWTEFVKKIVARMVALPDQLERVAGLTPKQVEKVEAELDEWRGDLHAELTKSSAPSSR